MLTLAARNFTRWVGIRILEVSLLFVANLISEVGATSIDLAAILEAAISTASQALIVYGALAYAPFLVMVYAVSCFWRGYQIAIINYLAPFYVPGAIYLSGSLPMNDMLYLIGNPFFMAVLLLSAAINLIGYMKWYHKPKAATGIK